MDTPKPISDFQADVEKRDSVKEFMLETLRDMAVNRVILGESIVGIKEAFELVEELFRRIDQEAGK